MAQLGCASDLIVYWSYSTRSLAFCCSLVVPVFWLCIGHIQRDNIELRLVSYVLINCCFVSTLICGIDIKTIPILSWSCLIDYLKGKIRMGGGGFTYDSGSFFLFRKLFTLLYSNWEKDLFQTIWIMFLNSIIEIDKRMHFHKISSTKCLHGLQFIEKVRLGKMFAIWMSGTSVFSESICLLKTFLRVISSKLDKICVFSESIRLSKTFLWYNYRVISSKLDKICVLCIENLLYSL